MTTLRRRPWLVWPGGVLATALLVLGAYLLVHRPDGTVAVDLVQAIEARDLDEVAALTDGADLSGAVLPDYPWTDARIVEVSPNDSAHDYDVTVEVASTDLTRSGGSRMTFAVGTVHGRDTILDPMTPASITARDGGELTAVTIDGRDLGSGLTVGVRLLPGIYTVTAIGADGSPLAGRLTVMTGDDPAIALGEVG